MTAKLERSDEVVFSLIDEVGLLSHVGEIDSFVRRIVDVYGLKNVAYFANNIPGAASLEPYAAVTYPASWVNRYIEAEYVRCDPVLGFGFASILPFDWRQLDRSPRQVRSMFGEAKEFDIGRQGLTFPVRGRSGDTALFTVTGDYSDQEWDYLLHGFTKDFQVLSFHIHQMVLRANGGEVAKVSLSPREIQCLQWVALGKTVWETGAILSLSTRTVRFYLDIARHKLGTTNITHAVGCAIGLGLIRAPTPSVSQGLDGPA